MAHAGLHVPAANGSRMTVFSCVFADIGDEQSIAASLSTFSGHMTNIASMEREFALPALILLDEVGSGTDPLEGGALGMAIVDHFRARGALVIATTHDDAMKSYGATTEGVTVAAFGFDPATFAPTYRLLYGMPGRSLALEIAARLGLPASVIADARGRRTTRESQLETHLARVERDMQALDHDRRLAAHDRQEAAAERAKLRGREEAIREREQQLQKRIDAAVSARVREAREEIDRTIAKLKQKAGALEAEAKQARRGLADGITTGDLGRLRAEAREGLERAAAGARRAGDAEADAEVAAEAEASAYRIGDRVRTGSLGFEGVIRAIDGTHAELEVLGKRIKARVSDLRAAKTKDGKTQDSRGSVRVNVTLAERSGGSTSEINVIGSTVDDAVTRVARFIDEALLTDNQTLRIIHGHGTGQLRKGLGAYLKQHPLVAKVSLAPPNEGGDAVTIIEIKD
jgi:DNA mismatch repair protein MutS2